MEQFFADLHMRMEVLPPAEAYVVLLAVAYAENLVPPIPGDLVVVFGGYLAGLGILEFVPVVAAATLGGAAGFMTLYAVGVRAGQRVFDETRMRWLPRRGLVRAREWLGRWGYGVVAANRFLSGARSVISLSVGMAGMAPGRTALWASASALVWTLLITYLGFSLGDNHEAVADLLRGWGRIVTGMLAAALLAWWWRAKRKAAS